MADTSANHRAEQWVVEKFLPKKFKGQTFAKRNLTLKWGGQFEFDAVSPDGRVVGVVSTSAARTAGNKPAAGPIRKIKSDALYLLHAANAEKLFMAFTEVSLMQTFEKERDTGRFPPEIELLLAPLPPDLQADVLSTRAVASLETSPKTRG